MGCRNWQILDSQSDNMSSRLIDYVRHSLGSCRIGVNSIPFSVLWAWIPDPSWLQTSNGWLPAVIETSCRVMVVFLGRLHFTTKTHVVMIIRRLFHMFRANAHSPSFLEVCSFEWSSLFSWKLLFLTWWSTSVWCTCFHNAWMRCCCNYLRLNLLESCVNG